MSNKEGITRRKFLQVAGISAGLWFLSVSSEENRQKEINRFEEEKNRLLKAEVELTRYYLPKSPEKTPVENPSGARCQSNLALGYAILEQPDLAIEQLEGVLSAYSKWQKDWTSALIDYPLAMAGWWLKKENNLPPQVEEKLERVLIEEANYRLTREPESGWENDTKAEENSWNATVPSWAAFLYPQHPNAGLWREQAAKLAFHTFTQGEEYGGVRTRTVGDDFLITNHGYRPHPTYAMVSWGLVGIAALPEILRGADPQKLSLGGPFWHNIEAVWQAHQYFIAFTQNKDPNDTRFINCQLADDFDGQDDWGSTFASDNGAIAYLAIVNRHYLDFVYKPLLAQELRSPMLIRFPLMGGFPPKEINDLLASVQVARHATAYLLLKYGLKE